MHVSSSHIAGNGYGGIDSLKSVLHVDQSTISDNVFLGGIRFNRGELLVRDSTIRNNRAFDGAGVWLFVQSGDPDALIINSTISGNVAGDQGGGVYNSGGRVELRNSTITDNVANSGGGVFARRFSSQIDSLTTLFSSIVAGNAGNDVQFSNGFDNPFNSQGWNVVGRGNAVDGQTFQMTDQVLIIDPRLAPLDDNGGQTETHALLVGSPAFNRGSNAFGLMFDQRGADFLRVVAGQADVGAIEQSLIVTTADDELDPDFDSEDLSLREAIEFANQTPGADHISFDTTGVFAMDQTIALTLGQLVVRESLRLTGPVSSNVTLDGQAAGRVLLIDDTFPNQETEVSISHVTLTGGQATYGGGILTRDQLTLSNVSIHGNTATYGGGLFIRNANVDLKDSTLHENFANFGGGIYSDSGLASQSLTITGSTISGNVADTSGGGAFNRSGQMTIRNSTITENSALPGRGSGVASQGTSDTQTVVQSTIIAGNAASDVDFGPGLFNSFRSEGANVIGSGTAVDGLTFDRPGDQTEIDAPLLAPLDDNGGRNLTHAILAGSPALQNGSNPLGLSTDQRGMPFSRMSGTGIDVGSFESQSLELLVDISRDELDGVYNTGDLSLREAIELTNRNPGQDRIAFDELGVFSTPQTIFLDLAQLTISDSLQLSGPGADRLILDRQGLGRVLFVPSRANGERFDVELSSLALTGGSAAFGGGILNRSNLTVIDSRIFGNVAEFGGGVLNRDGRLTIDGSTISGNTAGSGGGLYCDTDLAVTTTIRGSTISANVATTQGGGVLNVEGRTEIEFSTIATNQAPENYGAGVGNLNGALTQVHSSIIAGNQGTDVDSVNAANTFESRGYNVVGTGNAVDDLSFDNIGDQPGVVNPRLGPLENNGGRLETHALWADSPAINAGGPISSAVFDQRGLPFVRDDGNGIDSGSFERQTVHFTVGTVDDESDGDYTPSDLSLREAIELANTNPGADTIDFDTTGAFSDNQTIELTLGQLTMTDELTITGPVESQVTLDRDGAGRVIFIDSGNGVPDIEVTLDRLVITGGNATFGGGILNRENLVLKTSTVRENDATEGGGILSRRGRLTVIGSTISDNSADGGGGIYFDGDLTSAHAEIINSTISGNLAILGGGGLLNYRGLAYLANTTITENMSPDGSGSGIATTGNLATRTEMTSTIVSGNDSTDVDYVTGSVNSFSSLGFNLVGSGNAVDGGTFVHNDQTGVADPLLDPLRFNGGPVATHGLQVGSPARDAGSNPLGLANDQRGDPFLRDSNGPDVGTFEQQLKTFVVDTIDDIDNGDYSVGDLSFREAIELAERNPGADEIRFDTQGLFATPQTIVQLGSLYVNSFVSIIGPGMDALTIDGNGDYWLRMGLYPVEMSGLSITGSRLDGIRNSGPLSLTGVRIHDNAYSGINSDGSGSVLTLVDSQVFGNQRTGIVLDTSSGLVSTITGTTISNNSSTFWGGGIRNVGSLTIRDSTISDNYAAVTGGGIWSRTQLYRSVLTIVNSTISNNVVTGSGGGTQNGYGGGIRTSGHALIQHSTITGNRATRGGSGIASYRSSATLTQVRSSVVSGNIDDDVGLLLGYNTSGPNSFDSLGYNIIGIGAGLASFDEPGDKTNIMDPLLGSLANNGGPTFTHALLPNSPAINAGDPADMPGVGDVPFADQRGGDFQRVFAGRIDVGSFERQPNPGIDGDFNNDGFYDCLDIDDLVGQIAAATNDPAFDLTGDGLVDLADRDAWLAEAGDVNLGLGKAYLLGDGTLDGVVDVADFNLWNANKFSTLTVIPGWCAGNFNADHVVDVSDFNLWNNNKFTSADTLQGTLSSVVWQPKTKPNEAQGTDPEVTSTSTVVVTDAIARPLAAETNLRPTTFVEPRRVVRHATRQESHQNAEGDLALEAVFAAWPGGLKA